MSIADSLSSGIYVRDEGQSDMFFRAWKPMYENHCVMNDKPAAQVSRESC